MPFIDHVLGHYAISTTNRFFSSKTIGPTVTIWSFHLLITQAPVANSQKITTLRLKIGFPTS